MSNVCSSVHPEHKHVLCILQEDHIGEHRDTQSYETGAYIWSRFSEADLKPGLERAITFLEIKRRYDMRNADDTSLSTRDREHALNCGLRIGQLVSELKREVRRLTTK